MKKNRIEKINKVHFDTLNLLKMYPKSELRFFYEYYRLVDENKNPIRNIKKYIIDDLIEHGYLNKRIGKFTINKI